MMINDECYGAKAVIIDGIITFENGNSYDLNQPICEICKKDLTWDSFLENSCPNCKELNADIL